MNKPAQANPRIARISRQAILEKFSEDGMYIQTYIRLKARKEIKRGGAALQAWPPRELLALSPKAYC
ncbi:hypothetical protein D6817_01390 [Candidatus Pacearchaeota archaeon]|nr:MAG: hypothetical protein D6817_01390 [Candidatus Pacearchaeota archaeon]